MTDFQWSVQRLEMLLPAEVSRIEAPTSILSSSSNPDWRCLSKGWRIWLRERYCLQKRSFYLRKDNLV